MLKARIATRRIDSPKILMKRIRCLTKETLTKRYDFLRYQQSQGFTAMADEQTQSRVYGEVDFTFDNIAGQSIGATLPTTFF